MQKTEFGRERVNSPTLGSPPLKMVRPALADKANA